jgi:GR25 family glycosyltransferase involved in LPS biosynthesis
MKILFYIFVALLFIWYLFYSGAVEGFSNNIDYYVITLNHENRIQNIDDQQKKMKTKLQKIDGVLGTDLNLNELVEQKIVKPEFAEDSKRKRGQIGLCMSNLKVYNLIKERGDKNGYSVIFEDDFEILDDDFENTLSRALDNLKETDFDMLYLQNNTEEYSKEIQKNHGELIKDNVYQFDRGNYLIGTVAIVINNKNIDRILEVMKEIDAPTDHKIQMSALSDRLTLVMMYPTIIEQRKNMPSTI